MPVTISCARRGSARRGVGRSAATAAADDRVCGVGGPGVRTEWRVVARTIEVFGGLDILVNNVGLAGGRTITDTTDAEWQEAIDQTLFPAIRASRLAVPHMRRRGGGAIVMIASIWGRESGGRMTYNAVKAAEISLAKSLAQQLARDNIRVNSIAPGRFCFGGSWHRRQQQDPAAIAYSSDRTAVRTIRPRRGSRSRGGASRRPVRAGSARQPHRRRLPVASLI
jgi:NAD(P)-dependent dehydrogenase (short-subunit alcohol dehydrogenase family)